MQLFNAELKHICRRPDQLPLIAFVDKTKFATRTTNARVAQNGECDPGEVRTTQKWAKNELTTLFGLSQAKRNGRNINFIRNVESDVQRHRSRKAMLAIKHILTRVLSGTSPRQLLYVYMYVIVCVYGYIFWRFIRIRFCRVFL